MVKWRRMIRAHERVCVCACVHFFFFCLARRHIQSQVGSVYQHAIQCVVVQSGVLHLWWSGPGAPASWPQHLLVHLLSSSVDFYTISVLPLGSHITTHFWKGSGIVLWQNLLGMEAWACWWFIAENTAPLMYSWINCCKSALCACRSSVSLPILRCVLYFF